jgi:hypothetical protein
MASGSIPGEGTSRFRQLRQSGSYGVEADQARRGVEADQLEGEAAAAGEVVEGAAGEQPRLYFGSLPDLVRFG